MLPHALGLAVRYDILLLSSEHTDTDRQRTVTLCHFRHYSPSFHLIYLLTYLPSKWS